MKKGLIIAAAMILAVCLGVGGTLAYLFVKTNTVTNTFAPSNITLELKETVSNQFQMIPSVEMKKDPKVSASADFAYYVFVKVDKVNNPDYYLDYSIASGWSKLNDVDGVYYKALDAKVSLTDDPVLTDNIVTTKSSITKTDMDAVGDKKPQLIFTAYAIQQAGFDTVKAAWEEVSK